LSRQLSAKNFLRAIARSPFIPVCSFLSSHRQHLSRTPIERPFKPIIQRLRPDAKRENRHRSEKNRVIAQHDWLPQTVANRSGNMRSLKAHARCAVKFAAFLRRSHFSERIRYALSHRPVSHLICEPGLNYKKTKTAAIAVIQRRTASPLLG
jgi:hypothetical protein